MSGGDSEIDEGMTLDEDFIDIIVLFSWKNVSNPFQSFTFESKTTFIFLFAHLLILLLFQLPLAKEWN